MALKKEYFHLNQLLAALVQVKASNTSENLLNGIRQIIYSLHRAKDITKKAYIALSNLTIYYGWENIKQQI